MKIGMILDQVFPPDPRVENEAITLIDSGHEVFLFCLTYGHEKFFENIHGIQVYRYKTNKLEYKFSALSYDMPFYKKMMKTKIDHFIRNTGVDILHIHDITIAGAVFSSNKKHQLKIVLDLHDNIPENMKFYPHLSKFPGKYIINPKKWKREEERFIKKADRVITVSPSFVKDVIMRTGIKSKDIVLVPNTVRKSFFKEANISEKINQKYSNQFVVLYLGDTHLRRGLLTAIRATKILSNQIENFKLVIVGKNTTDYILKEEVKQLNIESHVDFEGWQDVSLFPSYIVSSNLCISPLNRSIQHDVAYPNKIFQYMSFGKPVLVSNATAQKEIIERANAGLVHDEKNENDFSEKVLELYHNKEKSKQLGAHGKKFIENEFSWEITSQALIKLYNEL